MTLTPQLLHAHRQLAALQQRAAWAHGLAYDRSAPPIDTARRSGISHPMPITITQQGARITAAADATVEHAWITATRHLLAADRHLQEAGLRHEPTRVERLDAPTIAEVTTLCRRLGDTLARAAGARLTRQTQTALRRAVAAIERADDALPDHRHPPRPPECRNPRNNPRCDTLPLYDKARRLCEPCYRQDAYYGRGA